MESTPIPSSKITPQETPVPLQVVSDGTAVAQDENRTRKIVVRVLSGALMVSRCNCCEMKMMRLGLVEIDVLTRFHSNTRIITDWNLSLLSLHGACLHLFSGSLCRATLGTFAVSVNALTGLEYRYAYSIYHVTHDTLYLKFRELVKVRYSAFFDTIQDTIPLFRTTQWMWFAVAIFYTYGDFFLEIIKSNQDLHYMVKWMQYSPSVAFMLYSATFVLTIATMQVGHIKFQLNQLCWTIVVLCLTVGNLKYISKFIVCRIAYMFVRLHDVLTCSCLLSYSH